jgi:hypothetical protein
MRLPCAGVAYHDDVLPAGNEISTGELTELRIRRGLVGIQGVSESTIHSDSTAKNSLIHFSESQNCELLLTLPSTNDKRELLRQFFFDTNVE